jgi:hypothetical protein
MSTAEIATAILLICGNGGTAKDFVCYDYYNNCVIDRSNSPTLKDFEACKEKEADGLKRIKKLQEEK